MIPYGKQTITLSDIDAVVEVMKSDYLTTGPKIPEFEHALCDYIGCKHAVVVNSGTSALDIAIKSCLFPKGSEIITTPFTFVATTNAILGNKLIPIFVDIEPDTLNIDPIEVRNNITDKTVAILCVDYAGQPCNLKALREIADKYGLILIEDAAHAIGAEYDGMKVGNIADLTTFSFHPVKNITTGEGGAITTNSIYLKERILQLRNVGMDKTQVDKFGENLPWEYDVKFLSGNYRMTDIQAALGISQLKKLDSFIKKRTELAIMYDILLENNKNVIISYSSLGHAWHLYTIYVKGIDRDKFFNYMRLKGVGVNLHYIPVYRHSYYANRFKIDPMTFKHTENAFKNLITLPLYPTLKPDEQKYICDTINNYVE